jgi:hypothetical protein
MLISDVEYKKMSKRNIIENEKLEEKTVEGQI